MAFINGKKVLTIIKGSGGAGGDIAITTLNGTTWKLKDPFNTDDATFVYNLNFISNNENFVAIAYTPESGLFYIKENDDVVKAYDETTNTYNEAYRTFKITGGADVGRIDAIGDLKHIANLISVDGGSSGSTSTGAIDLANIPVVESIDNPSESDPVIVSYNGELYLLTKESE